MVKEVKIEEKKMNEDQNLLPEDSDGDSCDGGGNTDTDSDPG
jgi:hypothetical protein